MQTLANALDELPPEARRMLDRPAAHVIAGEARASIGGGEMPIADPSQGRVVSVMAEGTAADVDAAVGAAHAALSGAWGRMAAAERERLLHRWADLIEEEAATIALVESVDVGMPLWLSSRMTVPGGIAAIRYMAGWPTKIAGRTVNAGLPIPDSAFFGYTTREPVGVVAAIIPWNTPFMMAAWKIAPALAAGCTIVLKPSEIAGLTVIRLAELATRAGIPAGVVNVVTGTGARVGEALVSHPLVDKVTFTGSTATGIAIAKRAAETVKKITLELGGKSPQILFADADLETALPGISDAIFPNSGQVCVAGSRLYVQRPRLQEVVDRLTARAGAMVVGPGLKAGVDLGPLASRDQQEKVLRHLDGAVAAGAELATGNPRVAADGFYVRPSVVCGVKQDMAVAREEIFGPVLTVMPFDDLDEAVTLANDTAYGLSACVWTQNLSTALNIAPRLKTGKVAINTPPAPYPALPEGGRKASGYGRDLGEEAIEGFLETKAVLIRTA